MIAGETPCRPQSQTRDSIDWEGSIARRQLKIDLRGASQPGHQPQGSGEQERRRIKSRCRTGKCHGSHRVPQNREQHVAQAVQKHEDGIAPRQWPQSAHPAGRHRSQTKQQPASHHQGNQPLSKREPRHGKPAPALAQDSHGWIVYGKKAGGGFIQDVQRERRAQGKPRIAKTRC
jgi:hypothetical protein